MRIRSLRVFVFVAGLAAGGVQPAQAVERLCDPADEDCRTILINLIRQETVGIDVAFWFMEDARYTAELIRKWQAGVPVRVLVDTEANSSNPLNASRLTELKNAGIPMRERVTNGILHWKMMLFAGQNTVEFSGANYSARAFVFDGAPYTNYVDEVICFTSKASVVRSFMTKYDDIWTNTTNYRNYANVPATLTREYPTFTKDPELNFPPLENFATRSVGQYKLETQKIDATIYRITDQRHTNALIDAINRGVDVRLITEQEQYRDPKRLWHSWNVDRLYMAGAQIRHRGHAGLNHQKSTILYGRRLSIIGSSNWTSPSASSQEEHNYFTADPAIFTWLVNQFERKWNNSAGTETIAFTPLAPDAATSPTPANLATGVGTSVTLKWYAGKWAHVYDVYFGTSSNPPLLAANLALGPSESTAASQLKSFAVSGLSSGTTYYWKVVSKTMANKTKTSATWSFTTSGSTPDPPTTGTPGAGDIVLHATKATRIVGAWRRVTDSTAASGSRVSHPNAGAAKITTAATSPANYFELTFSAAAGTPYRLWIRGKADSNHWANDSAFVQFSGSVTSSGAAQWRIGTTSATEFSIENCSGCGVAGWGWQDNGYNSFGPLVYFASTGTQTIRIQTREDGLSIDQIVLSPSKYLNTAPGALKNDTTILDETEVGGAGGGDDDPPPPPPPPTETGEGEIVIHAADAAVVAGAWHVQADATAAGGESLRHPNAGAAKVASASASPANYVEVTFTATASVPYRIWLRMKADSDHWANDSVFVQFDRSVNASGSAIWRIGTTAGAQVNLEDCSGCGVSNWGWQDNGYGTGILGPLVYFASTGTQRLRIQTREDGVQIDQIVLSPDQFLNAAPGTLKNDNTILAADQ
jgi:phosphatidylserine/phosphatidylglycerophosphate/cardiolipin synthase-like enzyme